MAIVDDARTTTAGTEAEPPAVGAADTGRPTFAEVYEANFGAVWRFVRSRIDDHHLAQDVTSDVFVRAWRSWPRFDHRRGSATPWLFTIAHRAVVDTWRRTRPEPTDLEDGAIVEEDDLPEDVVLREDLLWRLGTGLRQLQPRERDALAMRFAARLPIDDIAAVLGLGTSATKMLVHRAIQRLGDHVADVATLEATEPADLEAVIDDILDRGVAAMGDGRLQEMLVHLAVAHDPPTPDRLHQDVATCVECERARPEAQDDPSTKAARRGLRARLAGLAMALVLFVPVCLACTVSAASSLLLAAGLGAMSIHVHEATIAAGAVIVWTVLRARRRHGSELASRLALVGAALFVVHAVFHASWYLPAEGARGVSDLTVWLYDTLPGGVGVFEWTDRLGTALLAAAALVSHRADRRWRDREAALVGALARRTADPATVSA